MSYEGRDRHVVGGRRDFPKAGDRVRVKKGARISSTHPSHDGVKIAGRSYQVEVYTSFRGYRSADGEDIPPTVHWAGSGGYWKWCPLEDVEVVDV